MVLSFIYIQMLDSQISSIQELVLKQKKCLSPSELEFRIQSQLDDCGCSKNCLSKLIQRFNYSSSNSSSNNNSLTSLNVCHQIGRINAASRQLQSGISSPFQTFVVECRQPFYDVICGTTDDQQVASKQLHTFLVAKFEQGKVSSTEGKYIDWIYHLVSISQRPIEVCKTAYVAVTGISASALNYAQRKVRENVSSLGLTLGDDDITAFDRSSGSGIRSLEKAFDFFGLDYHTFAVNNVNSLVDITQIPDDTKAFLCVTYLVDWFGLSGEMEVFLFYVSLCKVIIIVNIFLLSNYSYVHSLILTSYIWILLRKKKYGKSIVKIHLFLQMMRRCQLSATINS